LLLSITEVLLLAIIEVQLYFLSPITPGSSNFSDIRANEDNLGSAVIEVVVGVVIGVCGVTVVAVFFLFGVFHMFARRDQGQWLCHMT